MKKILLIIILSLILSSCLTTGGLNDFYNPFFTENDYLPEECLLAEGEEPKIYYSENINSDINFLKSNYYQILGYSSFNGPAEGDELFNNVKDFCKQKRAKIAIYNYEYTDTRHGVYSYAKGYVSSYNIKRYDYSIVLFVDLPKEYINHQKTGFEIKDLDTDSRQNLMRNTGVVIDVVYNKTAAFYANLIKNDVIIKINDLTIMDKSDYYAIYQKLNLGDNVIITFIRNGIEQKITYKL